MKKLHWLFMSVILNTLLFVVPGGCYRIATLPDNCTCVTREGTVYSLFPLRRTDGKPKYTETGFEPHPNYYYSYNPCVPYTFTSKKGICENVALCKYNKDDEPVYNDIGDQRNVQCDISDGKVALIYPIGSGPYHDQKSRVNLVCDNNPKAQDEFTLINEDNLIFQLTSYCGCPNKCLPTDPMKPGLIPSSTSSSGYQTASSQQEDRVVPVVKETDRAVKHEEAWAKGKAKEPLQEEEDEGEEYSFAGKGDEAVLI